MHLTELKHMVVGPEKRIGRNKEETGAESGVS